MTIRYQMPYSLSIRHSRWMYFLIFLTVFLTGCSTINSIKSMVFSPSPQTPDWQAVVINAADDVNQNSPIAVDLVFVSDMGLSNVLLAMPSSKWFASRNDMQKSFPGMLAVISHELVPGQSIKIDEKLLSSQKGFAVIVYADYQGQGENRERLNMEGDGYNILLGAKGFKAVPIKKT